MLDLSLPQFFDHLARTHQNAPAIVYQDQPRSFASIADNSRRLAAGLAALGFARGDRLAVWLPNVPEWIELLVACARLGVIVVSVNTRLQAREVEDLLKRSGSKGIVFDPQFRHIPFLDILREMAGSGLEDLRSVILYGACDEDVIHHFMPGRVVTNVDRLKDFEPLPDRPVDPGEGCLIQTTSGTTSLPKFVLHSQRGLVTHARDVAALSGGYGSRGSVGLTIMPLCGAFGMTQTLGALAGGAPTILHDNFDAAAATRDVLRYGVTTTANPDDVYYRMLEEASGDIAFPTMRFVIYGSFNGSPQEFIRASDSRGLLAVGAYGMSEFQGIFARQPLDGSAEQRTLSGGIPVSRLAKVRVRDPLDKRLLGHGEVGELEILAPSAMIGYFGDEAATRATVTEDGYIRTGDSGYLADDGSFVFIARMSDTLRLSGFLVSPVEIAEYIETHPSVAECQVVGAHGPAGFRAVAFVKPSREVAFSEAELREHGERGLAKYKRPARYVAMAEFPSTMGPNGLKVKRGTLRDIAEGILREPV